MELPVAIMILALLAMAACLLYVCDAIGDLSVGVSGLAAGQYAERGVDEVNQNGEMAAASARGTPTAAANSAETSDSDISGE